MSAKRAFIISSMLHLFLLVGLSLGNDWWRSSPKKPHIALETNLLYHESKKKKDLLPKKNPKKSADKKDTVAPAVVEKELKSESIKPAAKAKDVLPAIKEIKPEGKVAVARGKDFSKKLQQLSKDFAAQLKSQKPEKKAEEIEGLATDDNYFQQVYSLIKESFVVPPHINGPQGKNLSAVLRIFLSQDGTLSRLSLEKSSGDVHFDKAVEEGTLRVHNFGRVPILLQDTLANRGVVVELCPFKCAKEP